MAKNMIYCSKCGAEYSYFGKRIPKGKSPCCSFPYVRDDRAIWKKMAKFELKVIKTIGE